MPAHEGCGRSNQGLRVAVGGEPAAGCSGMLRLLGGSVYRTQVGPGDTGLGVGSSSVTGWEEFGRPHPARTVPNFAQPS